MPVNHRNIPDQCSTKGGDSKVRSCHFLTKVCCSSFSKSLSSPTSSHSQLPQSWMEPACESLVPAMPRHLTPCLASALYVMPRQSMLRHASVCHVRPYIASVQHVNHAMPGQSLPCNAMPCHAMPCHTVPCRAMQDYTMQCKSVTCLDNSGHGILLHAALHSRRWPHAMPCHSNTRQRHATMPPCHHAIMQSCHHVTMPCQSM